jgi:predicted acylesterase/phospholipase RssA
MNAVVLADGLMRGGRDGAREALAKFWSAVASSVPFELAVRTMDGESVTLAPAMKMLLELTHFFSPYQLNPFDLNPLRDVVTRLIDFERLQRECPLRLFIAATNARTARLRLFQNVEITADALLASACLPTLHHAIEIDGDPYWDGGFSANPAVFPLFYECRSRDILLVLLAPHEHGTSPHTAAEIENRIIAGSPPPSRILRSACALSVSVTLSASTLAGARAAASDPSTPSPPSAAASAASAASVGCRVSAPPDAFGASFRSVARNANGLLPASCSNSESSVRVRPVGPSVLSVDAMAS